MTEQHPPRDLPERNSYAIIRSVGAMMHWCGRWWHWDGQDWQPSSTGFESSAGGAECPSCEQMRVVRDRALADHAAMYSEVERLRAEVRDLTAARDRVLAECDAAEKAPGVGTVRITAVVETLRAALSDPASDADEPREGYIRASAVLAGAAAPAGDAERVETREEWLVRWTWSDGTTEEDRPREDRQMAERQMRNLLRPPTAVASAKLYRRTVTPWVVVPDPADTTNTEA